MNEQIDSSIPVLTEVIHTPAETHKESTKAAAPVSATPKAPNTSGYSASTQTGLNFAPQALISEAKEVHTPSSTAQTLSDLPAIDTDDWMLLEQTVRENVLKQVLSRVDFVLEHRVSDSLADVLQKSVDQMADDIRLGLRKSIEEVVTRAVNQELTKLKSHR